MDKIYEYLGNLSAEEYEALMAEINKPWNEVIG